MRPSLPGLDSPLADFSPLVFGSGVTCTRVLQAGLEFGARRGVDDDTSDARRREDPFPLPFPFEGPGDVIVMEVVAVGGDWAVGLRECP